MNYELRLPSMSRSLPKTDVNLAIDTLTMHLNLNNATLLNRQVGQQEVTLCTCVFTEISIQVSKRLTLNPVLIRDTLSC